MYWEIYVMLPNSLSINQPIAVQITTAIKELVRRMMNREWLDHVYSTTSTQHAFTSIGYYPGKRVTSEAKPRATKLMLHAFLGSNLLVSFYFTAMASFKLVNCLKAHHIPCVHI